jgi:hypothetical protein
MTLGSSRKAISFSVSCAADSSASSGRAATELQGLRKPGFSNYFSPMNVNEPKVPG